MFLAKRKVIELCNTPKFWICSMDCKWNYKFCVWETGNCRFCWCLTWRCQRASWLRKNCDVHWPLEWNERYFDSFSTLHQHFFRVTKKNLSFYWILSTHILCLYYSQAFHHLNVFHLTRITSYTCIVHYFHSVLINQFLHGPSPFRLKHFVTSFVGICCIYDMVHCEHNQTTNESQAQGSRNH